MDSWNEKLFTTSYFRCVKKAEIKPQQHISLSEIHWFEMQFLHKKLLRLVGIWHQIKPSDTFDIRRKAKKLHQYEWRKNCYFWWSGHFWLDKESDWQVMSFEVDLFFCDEFGPRLWIMTTSTPKTIQKSCDLTGNFMHQRQDAILIGTKRKLAADTRYRWFNIIASISFWVHKKEIKKHFLWTNFKYVFFDIILFSVKT